MYKLHCFPQSGNSYKVALALALTKTPWEAIFVDYFGGITATEEWRKEDNAMGEVPILETESEKLTQSGVILPFLAQRTGKLGAKNPAEERDISRWILFDNHKFTSYFATYRWLKSFAKTATEPAVLDFLRARIDAAFGVVETHLGIGVSRW